MFHHKHIALGCFCALATIHTAQGASTGLCRVMYTEEEKQQRLPEMHAKVSIIRMQQDVPVKAWCDQFLTSLHTTSQELAKTEQRDILNVYTNTPETSAETILTHPLLLSLIAQISANQDVHDAFSAANKASLPESGKSLEERKAIWTTFREQFCNQIAGLISGKVNTAEQHYWSPKSKEEQGPKLFLENNLHLTLNEEQQTFMRVASALYFIPRAIQRASDPQTDDQYAVLSQETQKKWTNTNE